MHIICIYKYEKIYVCMLVFIYICIYIYIYILGSSDHPCLNIYIYIYIYKHGDARCKQMPSKARERAAKGSPKVQKSVPTASLLAWHSWTVAPAFGFSRQDHFSFHGQAYLKKTGARTCCNVASPATVSTEVLLHRRYCFHHQYHCPSMSIKSLQGQISQNRFSRKARERNAKLL